MWVLAKEPSLFAFLIGTVKMGHSAGRFLSLPLMNVALWFGQKQQPSLLFVFFLTFVSVNPVLSFVSLSSIFYRVLSRRCGPSVQFAIDRPFIRTRSSNTMFIDDS